MLFMLLCDMASVSQLCICCPYSLHGLCEDYLTCDIAFNAVMPLSRASTRGRYSRIVGVTGAVVGPRRMKKTQRGWGGGGGGGGGGTQAMGAGGPAGGPCGVLYGKNQRRGRRRVRRHRIFIQPPKMVN